jgi:homoserine dehydrogenase
LIDLSPVNLDTGEPSLSLLRCALRRGVSAVLANKAPLVLDFAGLKAAAAHGTAARTSGGGEKHVDAAAPRACSGPPRLAFSATVCGGLPVVNVGVRDLRGATFECIEGIFNSTTNFILAEMEAGRGRADALREAQRVGIAEADPTLDVEGLDTANKLVILSNEVLGQAVTLADVSITGISAVTDEDVRGALAAGECIRLVARAVRRGPTAAAAAAGGAVKCGGAFTYTVAPERVKIDSHLGNCQGTSMCCRYVTDIFETIDLRTDEKGVYPTAAAVLRDCFDVLHTGR